MFENMKQERHEYIADGLQLRSENEEESRIVEGYAIMFGVRSNVVGYDWKRDIPLYEVIERDSITEDYLATQDIVLCLNHDKDKMLARSKNGQGTLSYWVDDNGVGFRAELPHTADGDYALEHIRLGNLTSCSFSFGLTRDNFEIEMTKDDEGNDIAISHVKSFNSIDDMSIVRRPAYKETSVSCRAEMLIEDIEHMFENNDKKAKNDSDNYRDEVKALRGLADSAFDF